MESSTSISAEKSAELKKRFKLKKTQPEDYIVAGYSPFDDCDGYCIDEKDALLAIQFVEEMCVHVKDSAHHKAGEPITLLPWQRALFLNLFGWKSVETGLRRYREVFILVPRKNGKTTILGALIELLSFVFSERGGEIYLAASDQQQSNILFSIVASMIRANDELAEQCVITDSTYTIRLPNDTILRALSSESYTKDGYNASLICFDECHAYPDRKMVDVLTESQGSRPQPLVVFITTSDYNRPSICNEKQEIALDVRSGKMKDPEFFPIIFRAEKDDDWKDPAVWRKANPSLGHAITEEFLARKCMHAEKSNEYLNSFLRKHLNIQTDQDEAWLNMDLWDQCVQNFDIETLIGQPCFGAFDLSKRIDMTAFGLFWPETRHCMVWYWSPKGTARQRQERDKVPYQLWAEQKFLNLTEGEVVDYKLVRAKIIELNRKFKPQQVAYDNWNAGETVQELIAAGVPCIEFRQGPRSYNDPCKNLEAYLIEKSIVLPKHPILRWNATNVVVVPDKNDNISPAKNKSTGRIDGLCCVLMCMGLAGNTPLKTASNYERRGILVFGCGR